MKTFQKIKLEYVLLFLTITGLILKFYNVFYTVSLNSDFAAQGMMAIEFWKYHNYLFSYFYVPSDDSFILDDVIHLLPQLVTNYNPLMIKIVAFLILLLIIVIFSYIVFSSTKSVVNALFFSAILANWHFDYGTIAHESSILLIGLLLILYVFKPIKNWKNIFLIILVIGILSDSLIIIWFVLPFIIVQFLINSNRIEKIKSFLKFDMNFKIVFLSGIVMVFKRFLVEYYVSHSHIFHCRDWNCLVYDQIPLLLKDLQSLFFGIDINKIPILGIILVGFLITYTILFIVLYKSNKQSNDKNDDNDKNGDKNGDKNDKNDDKNTNFILIFFGIMIITTSLFYITTAIEGTGRYLFFILIGLLSIFCMANLNKSKIGKWLLIGIIFINLMFVLETPVSANISNYNEYKLINFLKKSNLSFGYGDYWDANIITLLSHEDVTIRAISMDNGLKPFLWWSAKRWYENSPEKFFVIINKKNNRAINEFNNVFPEPLQIVNYENYKIYEYNTSNFSRILDNKSLFYSGGEQIYDPKIGKIAWYTEKNFEGYVTYGPYISLPKGNYLTTFMIKSTGTDNLEKNVSLARLEIYNGYKIINQIDIHNSDLKSGEYNRFDLYFATQNYENLEFRVYKFPNFSLFIGDIILRKKEDYKEN